MPHIQIDYSPNIENRLDMAALCRVLRDAAVETGVFPLAGIRVRAICCTHVVIADGQSDHGFIDISVRLRAGRPLETKKRTVQDLFAAAERFCAPVMEQSSLMLSMEMRDIDADLAPKASSIRRYLPGETA